ncbi:MAG: nitroreductase/quinone reductase family protein [Antricoccus sp.]
MTSPTDQERPSLRMMNVQMTERLLTTPPAPAPDRGTALRVLQTTGRRSGNSRRTPIGVLHHNGAQYLVCPDRSRDWPQNLLSEPHCQILAGGHEQHHRAVPVDGEDAVGGIEAYLIAVEVPWARKAFGFGDQIDRSEIRAALPRMAIFQLVSARVDVLA